MSHAPIPYRWLIPHWVLMSAIQISVIAMPLIALDSLHADAQRMGYLYAVGRLPAVVIGLVVGAIVDRSDQKTLMLLGVAGSALSTLALAMLAQLSVLDFGILLALALTGGVFTTFYDTSFAASVAKLGTPDARAAIHHANQTAMSAIQLAGPTVAGVVVSLVGAPLALWANALLGLAAIGLLTRLPPVGRRFDTHSQGIWSDTVDGIRYCATHRAIRPLVGLGLMGNFLYSSAIGLVFLHARNTCHLPVSWIGVALSIGASGFLLGSMVFPSLHQRHGERGCHLTAVGLTATGWALVGLSGLANDHMPSAAMLSIGMLCTAAGAFLSGVVLTTLRQQFTPNEMQGRVSAFTRTVSWIGMPLGAVLGGWLAQHAGTTTLLTSVGVCYFLTLWWVIQTHKAVHSETP